MSQLDPTFAAIDRFEKDAVYYDSFPAFAARAWQIVDGASLIRGWFIDLLWSELEKWANREYRNLIIAVPPGSSKSISASVLLPAWMWLRDPGNQFLACTHSQDLSVRDNVRMRDLVRSEWYRGLVRHAWDLKHDQDQKTRYQNTAHGLRQGIGGKSGLAGWRGNDIIIDDPIDLNPRKPPRPEDLDAAYSWVQYIRRTRVNDPKKSRTLLIAQRAAENDPTGRVLSEEPEEWHTICFDLELDNRMPYRHPQDPRENDGDLLHPERTGPAEVAQIKRALGPDNYSAQCQQMPVKPGGKIVNAEDIPVIAAPLAKYEHVIASWDLAFKGEQSSSWVVGTIWGVNAPFNVEARQFDLIHVWRDHVDYNGSKAAVQALSLRYPEVAHTIIEDKANGPALISELRYVVPTIRAFNPNPYGDKTQRLRAITPVIAQHRLRIVKAEWNAAYLEELTRAPQVHDMDQVDSTTQAVLGCIHELPHWTPATRSVRLVGGWD